MSHMTRGGRALLNDLNDQLAIIRQALADARAAGSRASTAAKRNPDLTQQLLTVTQADALGAADDAVRAIERIYQQRLDQMLQRRAAPSDVEERVTAIERRVTELTRQIGGMQGVISRGHGHDVHTAERG